jgi:hypothetical protein
MSNIKKRLDKVLNTLDEKNVTQVAFDKFKSITPVKSGNAKRNTTKGNNTIDANYSYAQVLDKGRHNTNKGMRGSTQAPEGMSKPTLEHVREYVFKTLGIKI